MFAPDNECVGNCGEDRGEVGVREASSCQDLFLECMFQCEVKEERREGGQRVRQGVQMQHELLSYTDGLFPAPRQLLCHIHRSAHTLHYAMLCVQMSPPEGREGYICRTTG